MHFKSRFIGLNRHQAIKKAINVRRGEGGGEWTGGPLWSPVVPSSCLCTLVDCYPILFTDDSLCHTFTRSGASYHPHPRVTCPPDRVTIKALPASLHPSSPLHETPTILGLMRITAVLSAQGRPTTYPGSFFKTHYQPLIDAPIS